MTALSPRVMWEPSDSGSLALSLSSSLFLGLQPWGGAVADPRAFPISKLDVLVRSVDPESPGWFSSFQQLS